LRPTAGAEGGRGGGPARLVSQKTGSWKPEKDRELEAGGQDGTAPFPKAKIDVGVQNVRGLRGFSNGRSSTHPRAFRKRGHDRLSENRTIVPVLKPLIRRRWRRARAFGTVLWRSPVADLLERAARHIRSGSFWATGRGFSFGTVERIDVNVRNAIVSKDRPFFHCKTVKKAEFSVKKRREHRVWPYAMLLSQTQAETCGRACETRASTSLR